MQPVTLILPSPPSRFVVSSRRKAGSPSAPGCGCAATSDAQGAQAAALAALDASCTAAEAVVSQNPLGPYADSGSCSYDCGTMEQNWNWSADYRAVGANLQNCLAGMDFSQPYAVAYQATASWVGSGLPGISTAIGGDLQAIQQTDAAIAGAGGDATPAQQAQLASAFGDLGTQLSNNLGLLDQALQQLAGFVSSEQGQGGAVDSLVASSKAYIQSDATTAENNLLGQIACGSGDVQGSFGGMFQDVANKFATMQASFAPVDANFQASFGAVQLVTGAFLVLQQDSDMVSKRLASAQAMAPTDPLRAMDLTIAGNLWADLVASADAQFQPGV